MMLFVSVSAHSDPKFGDAGYDPFQDVCSRYDGKPTGNFHLRNVLVGDDLYEYVFMVLNDGKYEIKKARLYQK